MRISREFAAVAGLGILACAETPTSQPTALRVDSVKVIGASDDPAYTLTRVAGLASDREGRIYVADGAEGRVRVYGRDGTHLRDFGRIGHGPGEFLAISSMGVYDDTLYVIDRQADRVTFFKSDGQIIKTRRAASGEFGSATGVTFPMRMLPGGWSVVTPVTRNGGKSVGYQFLLARGAKVVDTLFSAETKGSQLQFDSPRRHVSVSNPFATALVFAMSPSGKFAVTVRCHPDAGLVPGECDVLVLRTGKDTLWERRVHEAVRKFTAPRIDSIISATLGRLPPGVLAEAEFRAAITLPKYEQPIRGAAIGDDGRVLLRRPPSNGRTEWLVFAPGGKVRGVIDLPASAGRMLVRGDTIHVVQTDELDVPSVVEYRIGGRRVD